MSTHQPTPKQLAFLFIHASVHIADQRKKYEKYPPGKLKDGMLKHVTETEAQLKEIDTRCFPKGDSK